MQNNQSGISFIEILVALLMISILLSITMPMFQSKKNRPEQKKLFTNFQNIVEYASNRAIIQKKTHKVIWDLNAHTLSLAEYSADKEEEADIHQRFNILPTSSETSITIPDFVEVKNFFINQKDDKSFNDSMNQIWFYLMPDGSCQPVTINLENNNESSYHQYAFTINPFYSKVSFHESFQSP